MSEIDKEVFGETEQTQQAIVESVRGTITRIDEDKIYDLTEEEVKIIADIIENGTWNTEGTAEQRAENNRRFAIEDSIRNAYVASFMKEEEISDFAEKEGLDVEEMKKLIVASRGNYSTICDFLSGLISNELKVGGIELLNSISAKDLRTE